MKAKGLAVVAALVLLASAPAAMAEAKIGFVNSDKVLREAAPAVRTQKRLEKEFEKREQDLQRIAGELKAMQENLEKNGMTLAEADRKAKEREFNDLNRDFQRRQREFRETSTSAATRNWPRFWTRPTRRSSRSPKPRSSTSFSRKRCISIRASTSPTR